MEATTNMLQVACPSCRGALTAPVSFAGATVQCPRCGCQMVLPSAAGAPPPQTAKNTVPPGNPRRVDDLLPPSATNSPPVTSPPATATFRSSAGQNAPSPAATATVAAGSDTELTAKFIARPKETTDFAPSKLPSLQLADAVEKAPRASGTAIRGPLLAIALVCSVLASAALLLYEPGTSKTITPGEYTAWQQMETHYFGNGTTLQPYQLLLRRAQQAHHRRDFKQRDALLRQVLDLLHAERTNPAFGVTGYQTPAPPNDRHLEETIMTLLRQP